MTTISSDAKIATVGVVKPAENKTACGAAPLLRIDNEEYKIVKKLPKRFPTTKHDVYITKKTDFNAQLERCNQLLLEGVVAKGPTQTGAQTSLVCLHAMGSSINRAINLALRLQRTKACQVNCYTSSILLEDDLLPLVDHLDISTQQRHISAVHIKISN